VITSFLSRPWTSELFLPGFPLTLGPLVGNFPTQALFLLELAWAGSVWGPPPSRVFRLPLFLASDSRLSCRFARFFRPFAFVGSRSYGLFCSFSFECFSHFRRDFQRFESPPVCVLYSSQGPGLRCFTSCSCSPGF